MEIEDDDALPAGVAGLGQNSLELYLSTALRSHGVDSESQAAVLDYCNAKLTHISSHIPQFLHLIAVVSGLGSDVQHQIQA